MARQPLKFLNKAPVTDLTDKHYERIGEIIFRFSHIENTIKFMIYEAIEINASIGRLSIRASRPSEMLTDFEIICKIKKLNYYQDGLEQLKKVCRNLKSRRDMLAHSSWLESSEEVDRSHDFIIMRTSGGHSKDTAKELGVKSRKIMPQATPISLKDLNDMAKEAKKIQEYAHEYLVNFLMNNQDKLDPINISVYNSDANSEKS